MEHHSSATDGPSLDEMLERTSRGVSRRSVLQGMFAGGVALLASPLLAACKGTANNSGTTSNGSGSGSGSPATLDSLTWGISSTVRGLDPAKSADTYSFMLDSLVYETLVTYDANEKVVPALAQSVTPSNDLKSYVYKLRPEVKFSDGSALTADDVVFSFERNMDPKVGSQISSFFTNVEKVTATAADEVTVSLKTPDVLFQYIPTFTFILSKAFVTKSGANYGTPFSGSPTVLGTGPFVPTSFQADQGLKLKANTSYWGTAAAPKTMSVNIIQTDSTRQLALRSGEIDGTFDVPLATAKSWTSSASADLITAPGLAVYFISLDVSAAPFDDIHVRRAIAYSLDTSGFVKSLLGGNAQAANSLVPRAMWSGLQDASKIDSIYSGLQSYPLDMSKAKAELAQSAHASGFSATVPYPSGDAGLQNALLSLKQNLSGIGITLDVKEVTSDNWLNTIYAHQNLGMQVMHWLPDYPDPADYLQYFYPSSAAVKNQFNMANFKNATVDKLLAKQNMTTDVATRTAAITQIMQISQQELPYIPLWWQDVVVGVRGGIEYKGLNALYYDQPWFRNVS